MARSLSIAAYLASLGSADWHGTPVTQPRRPEGTIIWARCCDPDQLTAVETLERKLSAEGDPIHIIATLHDWQSEHAPRALPQPRGKDAIRRFIAHWRPSMCVWVSGELDALVMTEIHKSGLLSILVDATSDRLVTVSGRWVPSAIRSSLSQFEAIWALDQHAADRLLRAGVPNERILITGAMEDCAPTLPCNEAERSELTRAIGTRPIWLTAAAQLEEWRDVCTAQQVASRGTHRLLSIIVPADPADAAPMADNMRQLGFQTALRSDQPNPSDVTQIYIVDTDEELGLWYRIAPITYMGGTLHGNICRDPFEATALGSAVLYGPHIAPFQRHAARLNAAEASMLIRSGADLGPAIESLLSVDKMAQLAHNAWDVTSRGADVTNRIAAFIQLQLEKLVP
jgi:3-deoxy-D-manno-octulosonic-acid transferase